jgi:osmoprotectant transport system ATP-binding protein
MLQLQGVSKMFGQTVALRPTDLTVPAGQTTVLIGPSGCGKSTLLRLMVGLITPKNARQLRQQIGFVVQDGGLFPHLTARGNVILMARHLGWPGARIEQRLAKLADLTHFPREKLDNYPAQLSGGQRQRVSLMRGLMLDPALLLFDEPLGALDPLIRSDLQEDLREIFKRLHKTVVLVTHDLGEAGFLGDRLVLLQAGRIVQQAPFAELLHHPATEFVSDFIRAQRPPPGLEQVEAM